MILKKKENKVSVSVKIYGAGSIGNHLAHACRRNGWNVCIVDIDPKALKRMRADIYPERYDVWDKEIKLHTIKDDPSGEFDVVFIGTPPDVRMDIALKTLSENRPRVLQMEKPLFSITDSNRIPKFCDTTSNQYPNTIVCVGYNHTIAKNTLEVDALLDSGVIGGIQTIDVEFREHWGGIFAAHPWLSGPESTYLGHTIRGGGAIGEHSHAIHLWLHFAKRAGFGDVAEVNAFLDFGSDGVELSYDRIASLNIRTKSGHQGRVVQDVVTNPPRKWARIQGELGFIEWICSARPDTDQVRWCVYNVGFSKINVLDVPKTRADEFFCEIQHIESLLLGKISESESSISLESGIDVMKIISAAYKSNATMQSVVL